MKFLAACVLSIMILSAVQAQLVVGVDDDSLGLVVIDVENPDLSYSLPIGGMSSPWAMTANDMGQELIYVDQDVLYRLPYFGAPEMIGQIRNSAGSLIDVTGLAFDPSSNTLFASRTTGGDDNASPEAIYEIDLTSAVATVVFDFVANDYEFGGLDFDVVAGKLYGTSDDLAPHGRGLYEIDVTGQNIERITTYPGNESDIDGLAINDGVAYLVTDQPGDFYRYDLDAGTLDTIPSPWTTNYLFSAAAWAPRLLPDCSDCVSGDFDNDGDYSCEDIDRLVAAIAAGSNDLQFDLNGSGSLDDEDLEAWLQEAGSAELASGNAYLPGDANLDGAVDGSDFIVWNANKFASIPAWCSGDFDADGKVDGLDFIVWNQFKFQTADVASSVPEPGVNLVWLALVHVLAARFHTGRRSRSPGSY